MATKAFFDEILTNVCVSYDKTEVNGIVSAVHEMVQRYARNIDERGIFNILRILPCGSMDERSSMWKTYKPHDSAAITDTSDRDLQTEDAPKENIPYIEFDFLALLQQTNIYRTSKPDCPGCMEVQCNYRWKIKGFMDSSFEYDNDNIMPHQLNKMFRSEVCKGVASLCPCICVQRFPWKNAFKFFRVDTANNQGHCEKCTVYKETGYLQIATTSEARFITSEDPSSCTFVLLWTSYSQSLTAPNNKTLAPEKSLNEIHIFVDFLPAYELNNESVQEDMEQMNFNSSDNCEVRLVVPKRCTSCFRQGSWRLSFNKSESYKILDQVSADHRKCYRVLKYLTESMLSFINSYHIKTVFLNHCKTCIYNKDYTTCVKEVLSDLANAYETFRLETSVTQANLLKSQAESHYHQMLNQISSTLKTLNTIEQKLKINSSDPLNQYSAERCIYMLQVCIRSELVIPEMAERFKRAAESIQTEMQVVRQNQKDTANESQVSYLDSLTGGESLDKLKSRTDYENMTLSQLYALMLESEMRRKSSCFSLFCCRTNVVDAPM